MFSIVRYSGVLVCIVLCSIGGPASAAPAGKELASGLSLVKKGKYAEARPLIEKACQLDPHNALAKLTLATLQDSAAAAESLYAEVAADTAAADSLRATADSRLGELYYVKKQFRSSSVAYGRVRRLRKTPETALAWAQSELMAGSTDSALAVADTVAALKIASPARQAAWISGECRLAGKEYVKAYEDFGIAAEKCDTCAWYLPALNGKYRCAVALDSGDAAKRLRTEIEKKYPQALEGELIDNTVAAKSDFAEEDVVPVPAPRKDSTVTESATVETVGSGKRESSAASTTVTIRAAARKQSGSDSTAAAPSGPPESYTIQVGSFGTRLNANALAAKLRPDFPEVMVVEAVIKDVSYYRVRIGTFKSLDDARSFAAQRFKGRSIRFQLVKL